MTARKLIHLLYCFSLLACGSPTIQKNTTKDSIAPEANTHELVPLIKLGAFTNPIACWKDTSLSYVAYLPTSYDTSKKYPILIAFDAHAAGKKTVDTYKNLCEKFGYLMVASNNSKNGLDQIALDHITASLLSDVKLRLAVDTNRIYACGFSGGARVAASLAKQGGISGLAGCSAGFQVGSAVPFNFIGFAGNEDFNSNEMIELNKTLDMTNTQHHLIIFQGKHEWPTPKVFEDAFFWFEFNAMKDKIIPLNIALLNTFRVKQEQKINSLKKQGNLYDAYMEADKGAHFLYSLIDCSWLLKERVSLENSNQLKKIFQEKLSIEKREKELQNYYRQAIQEKDYLWWKSEVERLTAETHSKQNSKEEVLLLKRTLSFLSLLSYMAANSTLNQNQLPQAGHYLKVYEKIDPNNQEVYYLQAVLSARLKMDSAVVPLLEKAVLNGFNDLERLEKEVDFQALRATASYTQLIGKIIKTN